MKAITSAENRWVKLAAALQRRKMRYKEHRFMTEGFRMLEELVALKYMDVVCFVNETGRTSDRFAALYENSQALAWEWYEVTESVYQKMKSTEHSQGVLAMVPLEEKKYVDIPTEKTGKYLYLHDIQDPGNLGTIIRTAAASGCLGILLSPGSVDVFNEKLERSTMGNLFRLPVVQQVSPEEMLAFARQRNAAVIACAMEGAVCYTEPAYEAGAVVVLGNEGNGLPQDLIEACDCCAAIPMADGVESLNVAVAASLFLYEGFRKKNFINKK